MTDRIWALHEPVEIVESLSLAWQEAEKAFGLPDDGIVAWSLELRHEAGPPGLEGGRQAEAWRSDTTTVRSAWLPGPIDALRDLAARATPEVSHAVSHATAAGADISGPERPERRPR